MASRDERRVGGSDALRRCVTRASAARHRLGQCWQELLESVGEACPDAAAFAAREVPGCPLSVLEWAGAMTRHFSLEQALRHGHEPLVAWLQLRQAQGRWSEPGDPSRARVCARLFDGAFVRRPLASTPPELLRVLVLAAQAGDAEKRTRAELLYPQDLLHPKTRRVWAKMSAIASRHSGMELEVVPYVTGGRALLRCSLPLLEEGDVATGEVAEVFREARRKLSTMEPEEGDAMIKHGRKRRARGAQGPVDLGRARQEKVAKELRALTCEVARRDYEKGRAMLTLVECGRLNEGRWLSEARMAESIDPRIDGEEAVRMARVARLFTFEQTERFGIYRLESLLEYLQLCFESEVPKNPANVLLVVPDEETGRNVKKRFADCSADELEYAVIDMKRRDGLRLSIVEERAEELRTPEGRRRWEEDFRRRAREVMESAPDAPVIALDRSGEAEPDGE